MHRDEFGPIMNSIVEDFKDEAYERSLEQTRETKARLLKEPKADPGQLGWVRFYEFKNLYGLERYREAYDLLYSTEPQPFTISAKNVAWMYSVASELAMHLGRPDEVVEWGSKCLEERQRLNDPLSALQCCQTVCYLLNVLQREDLNQPFADQLIELGRLAGAERPLIAGYGYLIQNAMRCEDQSLIQRIWDGKHELERIKNEFRQEAELVLDLIEQLGDA